MLIYELPAICLKYRAQPNVIRSFEPYDQMLYHRTILDPLTAYPIPAGTNYIVLTVQKTAFGLDIIPESLLPQLIQKGLHVRDFRKMKKFDQTPYKLPPPTPVHVPAEKRPLEEKSLPFSKRRLRMTPVIRRVSRRPELPMASGQIPVSPVKIPQSSVQIPEPPVAEPSVQISLSQSQCRFQSLCRFPRARHFGADGCTRLAHVVRISTPRPKNSSCFTRSRLKVLLSGSFPVSPSLEDVSASKYGGLHFGSLALHATGGRVRDLVDVVGRLRNASKREPTLAYGVDPTLETGFENTCGTLASESFGLWDAL
ncbi:uncharacterized protein TNCV_4875741 [Trichonephila clavipes]|nr:uncharacterized protein TNCV_4875741 [Trichonephila clavipes]